MNQQKLYKFFSRRNVLINDTVIPITPTPILSNTNTPSNNDNVIDLLDDVDDTDDEYDTIVNVSTSLAKRNYDCITTDNTSDMNDNEKENVTYKRNDTYKRTKRTCTNNRRKYDESSDDDDDDVITSKKYKSDPNEIIVDIGSTYTTPSTTMDNNQTNNSNASSSLASTSLNITINKGKWSDNEIELLESGIRTHGQSNLIALSNVIKTRTSRQVYKKIINSKNTTIVDINANIYECNKLNRTINKGKWSDNEIELLESGIRTHGQSNNNALSDVIKTRTNDQVAAKLYVPSLTYIENNKKKTN